jgi:hypothetical protein
MTLFFFTPSGLTSPTCVPSPLEFLSSRRFQWCSLLPFRSTRSFSLFAYGVALSISFSGFSGPIQQRARLTSSLEYGPTWRLRRYISRLSTAPLGDFNASSTNSLRSRPLGDFNATWRRRRFIDQLSPITPFKYQLLLSSVSALADWISSAVVWIMGLC